MIEDEIAFLPIKLVNIKTYFLKVVNTNLSNRKEVV